MAFEVTIQQILSQANEFKRLFGLTKNKDFKDQENRLRRIVTDLQGLENLRGPQNLQEVTDEGSTTTNPIEADSFVTTGGTYKQYVMGDGSLSSGSGLYSQTQNSSTITHASGEASIVGSGVGSLSVPANYFSVGDAFKLSIHGDMSSANNAQLRIRLKEGSLVIGQTTVTLASTTNQHFNIDATFVVRQVGGPGVAKLLTTGNFSYSKSSNNNPEFFYFDYLDEFNFNTTVMTTLNVTAEWLTPEVGNQLFTQSLNLYKVF